MKRISWILMSLSLITGTVAGLYLYRPTDSSPSCQFSDDAVRHINESVYTMIKHDPKTYLMVHKLIKSSPYLSAQKKAFLAKYYGHKASADLARAERLLRLYAVSQRSKSIEH
jgi:hypothetical protein